MLRNFFKTAIRNLYRNFNYTLLNIAGLAAGVAIFLLIYIFIHFETSFDSFHSKKDRIYRVLTEYHKENTWLSAAIPQPLPATIRYDFPQLEAVSGIYATSNNSVFVLNESGQTVKKFKEKSGTYDVEPEFFQIFDFKWLAGDPNSSLKDPLSAVLSRSTAEKYFGNWQHAMGRTVNMNGYVVLKITGVLEDPPANTDFQYKIITPYTLLGFTRSADWGTSSDRHNCYVLLPPNETEASFTRQLRAFAKKYQQGDNRNEFVLQPVSKVHLDENDSRITNYLGRTISVSLIRALWIIAAFILVIACVNFINLSTAQAVNRAREIGMRKVFGSNAWQIRMQFLLETFIIALVAVLLATIITLLAVGPIGKLLDIPLSLTVFLEPLTSVVLIAVTILVTLLAGFYPSEIVSRFNPVTALKSKLLAKSSKGITLRRALVVFQFVIAQGLIIAILIMVRQMDYFRNGSMGFDKEAVINVPLPSDSASNSKIDYIRTRLAAIPGIKEISFSSNPPAAQDNNWGDFHLDKGNKGDILWSISKYADRSYVPLYDLQLVAGRNFTSDTAREFLVSEKLVQQLGIKNPADALNKELTLGEDFIKGPIVGVLKNFHTTGFKDGYSPVFIVPHKRSYNTAAIKLTSVSQAQTALHQIQALWDNTFPDFIFEYEFLDAVIENFYKREMQQTQIYKILAIIAIFLGCLGLYGLVSFMAVQRLKEVGIRKVLGASVSSIVYMFIKEFILLIGIAFIIASPVAWYFTNKWLQNYAYRIDISWWIFIAGAAISMAIVLVTISFNAVRAAVTSPVKNLRTE
ncbi:ABC transporter permease [Longitalea luteola]|uniref:ABC transporter permease n=1 Tax=Longitalea luteola TaxID=2812563 RepID=UPI001A971E1B|nr:ABC transporter permease [Longitalea luteola]